VYSASIRRESIVTFLDGAIVSSLYLQSKEMKCNKRGKKFLIIFKEHTTPVLLPTPSVPQIKTVHIYSLEIFPTKSVLLARLNAILIKLTLSTKKILR
jgi:hypothetical protein